MASIDYRNILFGEFMRRRQQANGEYSAERFASDLDLPPATLEDYLEARQPISPWEAKKLASKLGLSETNSFMAQVALVGGETLRERVTALSFLQTRLAADRMTETRGVKDTKRELHQDAAAVVTEPHHRSILELVAREGPMRDALDVARRLGLPVNRVRIAIERLIRFGMIKEAQGEWTVAESIAALLAGPLPAKKAGGTLKQRIATAIEATRWDERTGTMSIDVPLLGTVKVEVTATAPGAIDPTSTKTVRDLLRVDQRRLDNLKDALWSDCLGALEGSDFGQDARPGESRLDANRRGLCLHDREDSFREATLKKVVIPEDEVAKDKLRGRYALFYFDAPWESHSCVAVMRDGEFVAVRQEGLYLGEFETSATKKK